MIAQIIGWFALVLGSIGFLAWAITPNGTSEEYKTRRALTLISIALFLICAVICFK